MFKLHEINKIKNAIHVILAPSYKSSKMYVSKVNRAYSNNVRMVMLNSTHI